MKLSLCGMQRKSRVINRNLNPSWDEHFEFKGVLYELLVSTLELGIWDKDLGMRDDHIGTVELSLRPMLSQQHRDFKLAVPSQGNLHLAVSWSPERLGEGVTLSPVKEPRTVRPSGVQAALLSNEVLGSALDSEDRGSEMVVKRGSEEYKRSSTDRQRSRGADGSGTFSSSFSKSVADNRSFSIRGQSERATNNKSHYEKQVLTASMYILIVQVLIVYALREAGTAVLCYTHSINVFRCRASSMCKY